MGSLQEATRRGAAPTVAAFLEGAGQRDLLAQYQVMLSVLVLVLLILLLLSSTWIHCCSQATEVDLMTGCRRLAEEVKRGLEQLSLYHALSR